MRLSKDGLDYLTTFTDEIEPKLAEGGELHPIADWANKLAGAVVRIAAILHYANHSHSPNDISEIPPNTINRAIQIGRYLIPHAQAAYAEMGADPEVELAKRILRWVEKGAVEDKEAGGKYFFRKQDLWQGVKGGAIKKAADLDKGLAILEEHLFTRPAIRDSQRGGKVKVFFEANPAIFTPSPNSPTSDKGEVELGGLGELGLLAENAQAEGTVVDDLAFSDWARCPRHPTREIPIRGDKAYCARCNDWHPIGVLNANDLIAHFEAARAETMTTGNSR